MDKAWRDREGLSGAQGAFVGVDLFAQTLGEVVASAPNAELAAVVELARSVAPHMAMWASGEGRFIVKSDLRRRGGVGRGQFCAGGEHIVRPGQHRVRTAATAEVVAGNLPCKISHLFSRNNRCSLQHLVARSARQWMMKTNPAAVCLTAMLLAALAASCSDSPIVPPGGSSGGGGSGGAGGASTSSSSSSSSSSGEGGGTMTSDYGHSGTEVVNGGQFMKSDKYSMVYTIGQPSQVQSTAKSDKYRMQGGIVGATGSLP